MGIICLYVLIQKSGQKTAKSQLCAMLGSSPIYVVKNSTILELPKVLHD